MPNKGSHNCSESFSRRSSESSHKIGVCQDYKRRFAEPKCGCAGLAGTFPRDLNIIENCWDYRRRMIRQMGMDIVEELRDAFRRVWWQTSMFLCKYSFDLWGDDAKWLWLHVVSKHALDLWLYGNAKLVRINT